MATTKPKKAAKTGAKKARPTISSSHGAPRRVGGTKTARPGTKRAAPPAPERASWSRPTRPGRPKAEPRGKQDALRPRRPPEREARAASDRAAEPRVDARTEAPRVKSSHAVDGAKKKITKAVIPRLSGEATSVASDDARELAIMVAAAALEKKASGLEILDVAGKVDYADFLVLMTGTSDRQVAALAQGIEDSLRLKNRRALSIEGLPHAHWVLMDYGDVVVHVFQDETRGLYDLEGLWMDARRLPVPVPDDLR